MCVRLAVLRVLHGLACAKPYLSSYTKAMINWARWKGGEEGAGDVGLFLQRCFTRRSTSSLAFVGATAIFVVHLLQSGVGLLNSCERGGDISLLALQTAQASDFRELLGPYSRYRFNHPGPVLFYWYAFVEFLLGSTATPTGALFVGQLCLNFLCLVALMWVVVRRSQYTGSALFLVAALLVVMKQTGEVFLHYPWNPAALLFPAGLFIGALSALVSGERRAAPLVGVAWGILVSHHVGAAVWATVVGGGVLLVHRRVVCRQSWLWLAIILTGMVAVPLLIEACVAPDTSNVLRFVNYLKNHRIRTTLAEGVAYFLSFYEVMEHTGETPAALTAPGLHRAGAFSSVVIALLLTGVPWCGRFVNSSLEWGARRVATFAVVVGLVLSLRVDNTKYLYLMWFLYPVIGIQVWLCMQAVLSLSVGQKLGLINRTVDSDTCVVGCSVMSVLVAGLYVLPQSPELGGYCQEVASVTVSQIEPTASYRLAIRGRDSWVPAAAIVNSMYRAGVQVCVDKRWGFLFGRDMVCADVVGAARVGGERAVPDRILTITSKPGDGPGGRLIFSSPLLAVYEGERMS